MADASPITTVADRTADGYWHYSSCMYGRTLAEWAQLLHLANCKANQWTHRPLRVGSFGFETLVYSAAQTLPVLLVHPEHQPIPENSAFFNELCVYVHNAWARVYVHWRDHRPSSPPYFPPRDPLGDHRRNRCAELSFNDLPEDEKEKDRVIMRALLAQLLADGADYYLKVDAQK